MQDSFKEKETKGEELSRYKKEVRKLSKEIGRLREELQQTNRNWKELEEQTLVFKSFAETSGQGFGMAHLDGSIIYVNPALCRLLEEKQPEEVYKKSFLQYYSPRMQVRLRTEILPRVISEGQWTGELALIGAKGTMTSTLENFFLLRSKDGEPLYIADMITDISEQKAMSTALAEYSPNMIFINVKGRVVYANKVCEEMMGYSREELYAPEFNFLRLTAPEFRETVMEKFHQHMAGEEVPPYEYALLTKDGRKLYTVLNTKLITYEGESAILGVVTDITDRRKMEEDLRESAVNLRAILEASKESVFLIDIAGQIVAANQTMAERLGETATSVIGKNIYDLLPSSIRQFRKKKLEEAFREKKIVRFDDQRNGLWLDTYVYPVIEQGRVTRLAILSIDISERKKTEQSLRDNESLLRATIESIGTGILVVNDQGKVTHANKKFAEMWKIPDAIMETRDDDKLLGFVLDQLTQPDIFIKKVKELYQDDRIDNDFLEFKDGRYFERISHPLLFGDKIAGRVWGFRDITQRKKMESEIQQINEELQESNATKDKFFSIIAHDLRSPFSGLLGLSEVISDPSEELTIQEIRKYGSRLHLLLKNQFNLLQNLLEWSRLQQGRINFKPELLHLNAEVNIVMDQLSVNFLRKNIELISDIDSSHTVLADADMLKSILLNILSNAIKFTDSGGTIKIRSEKMNNQITVTVEDNGIGISDDLLTKLFKLEKVSSTPGTAGEKGTGLGLLLCKEFIEKHGGTIHVESQPGEGSTFIFTLTEN